MSAIIRRSAQEGRIFTNDHRRSKSNPPVLTYDTPDPPEAGSTRALGVSALTCGLLLFGIVPMLFDGIVRFEAPIALLLFLPPIAAVVLAEMAHASQKRRH